MTGSDQIQAIESSIQRAKKEVDLGDALERLRNHRDFKKVILEDYFEKEAVRLVHLKSDPCMQKPEMQQSILAQMDAIGAFSQFLNTLLRRAELARKSILSDEEMREELLAEERAQ